MHKLKPNNNAFFEMEKLDPWLFKLYQNRNDKKYHTNYFNKEIAMDHPFCLPIECVRELLFIFRTTTIGLIEQCVGAYSIHRIALQTVVFYNYLTTLPDRDILFKVTGFPFNEYDFTLKIQQLNEKPTEMANILYNLARKFYDHIDKYCVPHSNKDYYTYKLKELRWSLQDCINFLGVNSLQYSKNLISLIDPKTL